MDGEITTEINDGLRLTERVGGHRFGTDALLLARFLPPRTGKRAVEFGCGSGAVSLLAAAGGKCAHIDAVELSASDAALARRNVAQNGLDDLISVYNADLRDFSRENSRRGAYDAVFSNPPYMKTGSGLRSADAGRDDARRENNGGITDFAASAAALLRHGGRFFAVYRPERLADLIAACRAASLEPKRLALCRRTGAVKPSLVLIEARLGASSGCDVLLSEY